MSSALDAEWMKTLIPDMEANLHSFQVIDVQVVDNLPQSFDGEGDCLKGSMFLEMLPEPERRFPKECTVLLFGCTKIGNSVLARVEGFRPSLYFEMPDGASLTGLRATIAQKCEVTEHRLECRVVYRKNMYGWVPESRDHPKSRKDHRYLEVLFPTVSLMRKAARILPAHEDKVSADTKFMDALSLVPSGWVNVRRYDAVHAERISHCRHEVRVRMADLSPSDCPDIAPMLTANVDIECISASGAFPDASLPDDEVVMIGVNYWRVGTPKETTIKVCYVNTQHCDDIPGGHVMRYDNELEMLRGFRSSCFVDMDPDILVTFNGFGFDLPYLVKRAKLGYIDDFLYMDRIRTRKCNASLKELSSSALGNNELFIIDMFGRSNLDIFHWIKAREKLDSYKLDSVAEHFLGEKKIEMDYKELFRMSYGTPAEVAEVGRYCLQDCYLLVLLAIRLQIFAANMEMSRVCHTPMEMLVTRGQQVKVINQLVWYGHRMERREDGQGGYIMNTPKEFNGDKDDSYEGATVIDAKAKYYTAPVATLDFMSLYPSIILANNFCFSTLVQDPAHLGVPGVEYITIEVTPEKRYCWARNMPGVIPVMLRALLKARKDAKKAMAAAANRLEQAKATLKAVETAGDATAIAEATADVERAQIEKSVYNARQLALKVSANSIYGFTGAVKTGKYHCLGVADCTTFRAREMLHDTVRFVKEFTAGKCDVVYGDTDSIMVLFEGADTVEDAAAIGERAADWITERFKEQTGTSDIVLEFEKVYLPYLLMKKKRYAGLMYERGKDGNMINTKLDAKGIELVRRDNCAVAKEGQSNVLNALMYKLDPQLAVQAIHDVMTKIVKDEVHIQDYKLSKARRKEYVSEDLPHINVCKKMAERNPGSEPQVGDRVPYVLTLVPNNAKAKTWIKAEDIKFVMENPQTCKIDRLYYVEHQIINQIEALMYLVEPDIKRVFEPYQKELARQQAKLMPKIENQRTLADFFNIVPATLEANDAESTQDIQAETQRAAPTLASSSSISFTDYMMALSSESNNRYPAKKRRKK